MLIFKIDEVVCMWCYDKGWDVGLVLDFGLG